MTTTHAHHATEWQLQAAAEGKLGAIALPLEEYFAHTVRDDNLDFVMGFVRKVFNEGDRLYLAENWCKGDWGAAFDDDIYFIESTTPEAENIGWQPAETMPAEAAKYWFEITDISVIQAKDLENDDAVLCGCQGALANGAPSDLVALIEFKDRWDQTYPEYRWNSDRWIILLSIKRVKND